MKRGAALTAVGIFVGGLLAGCATGPRDPAAARGIGMRSSRFSIASRTIARAGTLTFTNDSPIPHVVSLGANGQTRRADGAATFGSDGHTFKPGATWTTPPWNAAGRFRVTCTLHPTMNLVVVVTDS